MKHRYSFHYRLSSKCSNGRKTITLESFTVKENIHFIRVFRFGMFKSLKEQHNLINEKVLTKWRVVIYDKIVVFVVQGILGTGEEIVCPYQPTAKYERNVMHAICSLLSLSYFTREKK